MRKYWIYLIYILAHKWQVFKECFKCGLYWQGITHDLSKFRFEEFVGYANYFYGTKTEDDIRNMDYAWLSHQRRNRHHFQWWVMMEDEGTVKILRMPERYWKEMACDWGGMSKIKNVKEWYGANRHKIILHPETRKDVEEFIKYEKPVFQRKIII